MCLAGSCLSPFADLSAKSPFTGCFADLLHRGSLLLWRLRSKVRTCLGKRSRLIGMSNADLKRSRRKVRIRKYQLLITPPTSSIASAIAC